MADLVASPLGPAEGFNWVFLVDLLVCGILALFFLFYFNRLFATLVSYGIRAYTWHRYRAYIDITALQISLLGGRIFFKTVRYHAHNITVLVHDGHLTWRYWLRQVQEADIFEERSEARQTHVTHSSMEKSKKPASDVSDTEAGEKQKKELPCRMSLKASGIEAFIYNRSPSYDAIIEATLRRAQGAQDSTSEASTSEDNAKYHPVEKRTSPSSPSATDQAERSAKPELDIPGWLHVFPIQIQCNKAAAVIGNENTTSVLTAKVENTIGRIDATVAQPSDLYKMLLDFEFRNITVAMKPNRDYKCPQSNTAHIAIRQQAEGRVDTTPRLRRWFASIVPPFIRPKLAVPSVRTESVVSGSLAPSFQNLPDKVPGEAQWHGLTRYLTEEYSADKTEWKSIEYGKASTLAECPRVTMRFHYDAPGLVTESDNEASSLLGSDIVGATTSSASQPDYGLDLAVHGGFLTYGPWADRQRVNIQKVFFPATYVDARPRESPTVGETRLATIFKLYLSIEEDVTLRIPTREASKDLKWKGRANNAPQNRTDNAVSNGKKRKGTKSRKTVGSAVAADSRPYGWLDITVQSDSTVRYTMDMYAQETGFKNSIAVDVKGSKITSSVNHDLLWSTNGLTVEGDLSNPLKWNALRDWPFKIVCNDMELFILRDHMFLIIDLVNDWGSGPPPDFYTFLPMRYTMDLLFNNFKMYLNTNDANIINEPANFETNDYLTLEGDILHGVLGIPLVNYRPTKNEITFDVDAHDLCMRLLPSTRNTLRYMLKENQVARLPELTLLGSFEANQEQVKGRTDTLRMDIQGIGFSMQAYGFVLRHLINIKENYFGDFIHFKTLEEFQNAGETVTEANEQTATTVKPKSIVELDVLLSIMVKDATIMLPTNLYSAKQFLRAEVPEALIDLRVGGYYLDLAIDISPVSVGMGTTISDFQASIPSSTQLHAGHARVYGHRAFGLPPNDAPYACTWEIDVGALTGEMAKSFLSAVVSAAQALMFTFKDNENALPLDSPLIVFDASFVQVRTGTIRVWLILGEEALLLSTDPITVNTNDWADELFSQRVSVVVPNLTVACVEYTALSRHAHQSKGEQVAKTYGFLQTSIMLDVVGRKPSFIADALRQQAYIRRNDLRTRRVPFLQRSGTFWEPDNMNDDSVAVVEPPAMIFPPFPAPLDAQGRTLDRPASIKSVLLDTIRPLMSKPSTISLAESIRNTRLNIPQSNSSSRRSPSSATQHSARSRVTKSSGHANTEDLEPGSGLVLPFSSPYARPHFLLGNVQPDESSVPAYLAQSESEPDSSATSVHSNDDVAVEDAIAQTTIHIELAPGIRAYAEPKLGYMAADIVDTLQAKSSEDVMDAFQMAVLADVTERSRQQFLEPKVIQIGIKLPSLVLTALQQRSEGENPVICDLALQSLDLMTRIRTPADLSDGGNLSFHGLLGRFTAQLRDTTDLTSPAALHLSLDDLFFYLALGKARNLRVTLAGTTLEAQAQAAPFFASIPRAIVPLVTGLQKSFADISGQAHHRLQLLLYQLTQLGEHVEDPPFLTKMTFILRAFPAHFRNQESWKVLMRFRSILNSMPKAVADDLNRTLAGSNISCPEDAAVKMLESWTQWRNWDVINIGQTAAFRKILEQSGNGEVREKPVLPVCMTWAQGYIHIAIQDRQKDSVLKVCDLSCGIELEPPRLPTGLMLVEENKRTRILSHVHTTSFGIELQWPLVDLVEEILPHVLQSLPQSAQPSDRKSTTKLLEDEIVRQEVHLVVSTDTGNVSLRATNVHHNAHADALRLSLIGTTQAQHPWGIAASALLNANTAGIELSAGNTKILHSILTSPSLYVDHLRPRGGEAMPSTVNIAIAYNEVQVNVIEQLPGILRVVDTILAEEGAQIVYLMEMLRRQAADRPASTQSPQQASSRSQRSTKVHVALLAGQLSIEVSLLKSLKYRLAGTAASMRMAPSLVEDDHLSIDFETGHIQHSLVNISRGEDNRQRVVDVPPVNGHIKLSSAGSARKISVLTTVGKLEIDAEAVQVVATTLNRSEVQDIITAIKSGIEDIQERVADVMPANKRTIEETTLSTSQTPEYEVRLSLAGIRVAASTTQSVKRAVAAFELGIGSCNAVISNAKSIAYGSATWFPQIRGDMHDIGAKLIIKNGKTIYPAGNITLTLAMQLTMSRDNHGQTSREFTVRSRQFEVNIYPETAAITVDVINRLQDHLKHLDVSGELDYLRSLRGRTAKRQHDAESSHSMPSLSATLSTSELLSMKTKIELTDAVVTWLVHADSMTAPEAHVEDLVLTLAAIELSTNGIKDGKLTIKDLQLQLVERGKSKLDRTLNSALLPEVAFSLAYWSEGKHRHLAFKASGKPLDLRLDSRFVVPFSNVKRSVDYAVDKFKAGTANWKSIPTASGMPRQDLLGSNHFASLTAEADFAGAQVYLQGSMSDQPGLSTYAANAQSRGLQHGRYGQFSADGIVQTTLKSPGISLKLRYENKQVSTVQAELMVASSSNMLLPTVVPLVLEISNSIKEVMQSQNSPANEMKLKEGTALAQSTFFDEALATADPAAIFGKTKINLGLRIARQEFALTCQPIAKIDAKAELDDLYVTVSTIEDNELGHFFAVSGKLSKLSAKVRHVYSREPTFGFEMDSVALSLMNSKHFSGVNGIAAILKIDPTRTSINGKQLQDLLLFREIWLPPELRNAASSSPQQPDGGDVLMQRYQLVAKAAAFPWNATIAISELSIDLDLGQSLGKSSFRITDLWASSQKTSDAEQNLCIGLEEVAVYSQGRMSGFVNLSRLAIRTLIKWPEQESAKTPRIQASIGFGRMRAKAAFDYQAFAFGDVEGLDFLMYNVRDKHSRQDRLVAILDCAKAYVFCTSTSPAQAFTLYQAVDRLIQEKQAAFSQALRDVEKHIRHESLAVPRRKDIAAVQDQLERALSDVSSITLHTDVVVSLGKICLGAFPGTFFDSQLFKVEADNLAARFTVGSAKEQVRSGLGMTIGQLQVALAAVKKVSMPKQISDLGVDEVVAAAVDSRGGVILRVPKVVASMDTWQQLASNQVEYIFKSRFLGKVEIGWNLSRINLIRGMWSTHSRALASRMGKPLPESAVKITADLDEKNSSSKNKITAEVNLPQSRYEYIALEPPIIETPQLRDMGEATPPLEWIGLNRDRLPHLTHSVIILALQGVAKQVGDAYGRILGSSS